VTDILTICLLKADTYKTSPYSISDRTMERASPADPNPCISCAHNQDAHSRTPPAPSRTRVSQTHSLPMQLVITWRWTSLHENAALRRLADGADEGIRDPVPCAPRQRHRMNHGVQSEAAHRSRRAVEGGRENELGKIDDMTWPNGSKCVARLRRVLRGVFRLQRSGIRGSVGDTSNKELLTAHKASCRFFAPGPSRRDAMLCCPNSPHFRVVIPLIDLMRSITHVDRAHLCAGCCLASVHGVM
jgi:hypothetical protein